MGLSIHYSGKIKDRSLLPDLFEEVEDVCTALEWPCEVHEDGSFSGVFFTPPECETVSLSFLKDDKLVCLSKVKFDIKPADIISVKTQFAGIDVHRTIIKLFRHLKKKYFSEFEMKDESRYWETGDETELQTMFKRYNFLLATVSDALKDFKTEGNESPQSLADRLEDFLKKRFGSEPGAQ